MGLRARIAAIVSLVESIVAWVMKLKPVRVFVYYGEHRGPLLSAGLSYQAIFAVFAALWVSFAIAGLVVNANPLLQTALIDFINLNVPGLIDNGTGEGAINLDSLLSASILSWTGAIAAVGLFFTALGWLAAGRDAVRTMFELPNPRTNFFLIKLKDLALALAFGLALAVSAVLSVLSTSALSWVLHAIGVDEHSTWAIVLARGAGLVVVLVFDALVLGTFYRVVSDIRIPFRLLAQGTILAAVALGVLKVLGTTLLGGATNNPLLAGFAVIIGLLIWFNFVCQVFLIGAAWIAVGARDANVDLTGERKKRTRKLAPPA